MKSKSRRGIPALLRSARVYVAAHRVGPRAKDIKGIAEEIGISYSTLYRITRLSGGEIVNYRMHREIEAKLRAWIHQHVVSGDITDHPNKRAITPAALEEAPAPSPATNTALKLKEINLSRAHAKIEKQKKKIARLERKLDAIKFILGEG